MPSVEITLDGSTVVLLAAASSAFAAAVLFYRFTLPTVSTLKRLLLSTLRAAALGLIVALVFAPALRIISSSEQVPLLALLIDGTESMTLEDGNGVPRFRLVDSLLRAPDMDALASASRLQSFRIGAGLTAVPAGDSVSYDAPVTDLAAALETLSQRNRRLPFNAALLLTDGVYTRGDHPVHAAEHLGIPIVAVGIGDTTEGRDVLIARVAANSLVYEGIDSPVDITVRSTGAEGQRVDVRLVADGRTLTSSTLTLGAGTQEYTVRLSYLPQGTGMQKFTAAVTGLTDERTLENNRRVFFARVLKSRLRIMILAGSPSPDLATTRFSLETLDRFTVSAFPQRSGGSWYGQLSPGALLDSTDCVVLVGFPTPSTPPEFVRLLAGVLTSRRTPVLFLGGRDVDYARAAQLGDLLPFTTSMPSRTEQFIAVAPSPAERTNQLLTLGRPDGADVWKRLPPAFSTLTVYTPRPGAATLAEIQTQGGFTGGPLILTRTVGGQKTMAVLAHGIWRWRLMAQGRPETQAMLVDFLTAAVEWLTTREDSRPLRISPSRPVFAQGEPVEFTAELYDANNRPVQDADIGLRVLSGETRVSTAMHPIGNGRYEGTLEGLPEGDYFFTGRASDRRAELGADSGRFAVGGMNVEFQDTRMNQAVLREITGATGGAFFTVDRFDSAVATIRSLPSFAPVPVQDDRRFDLWTMPAILGAIILLLSAEWYLRKRSGML